MSVPDLNCVWNISIPDYFWETECGKGFFFSDEGPKFNGFLFCPFCGKSLVELESDDIDNSSSLDGDGS